MTRFSFYGHVATQSEYAHRLSSSESCSISGSDYSDFEAWMGGEHNERVFEPVGKIRPS